LTVALLFNHGLVEGVARRPAAETSRAVGDLMNVLGRARLHWPRATLYVHDELWKVPAETNTPFREWASRNARRPDLRDVIEHLLRACDQGPYLSSLPVDDAGVPEGIEPWPENALATIMDVVERGLHHRLAFPESRAWLVSFGAHRLPAGSYRARRGAAVASIANLLSAEAADGVFSTAAAEELPTARAVLDRVAHACPHVQFLDPVWKGIDRALVDVPLPKLYRALAGLEAYAVAVEANRNPKLAYEAETGIEVTDESASVHRNPNLRRQLEFRVPKEPLPAVFGYHAKVGYSTRVHFTYRVRNVDVSEGRGPQCTVWVGRIGAHPRGSRG
jgi:hypothetical protein